MKENKKFLRQCIICRGIKNKSELIRLTRNFKTGEIEINPDAKIQGRSVYICKNSDCLEKALKKNKIETFLKGNMQENIKEKLFNLLTK